MTKAKDELAKQLREELAELATSLQGDSYYSVLPDELGDEHIKPFLDIITAHTNAEIAKVLDRLPLDCGNCGKRTIYVEAELRNFNYGMCAACGADALHAGFWAIQAEQEKLEEMK